MRTSQKAQHTPRLRTYSSRRHRDDSGRGFLAVEQRTEIRKVLTDYHDRYKSKAAISNERFDTAVDEVAIICQHYENRVKEFAEPTAEDIAAQKRNANSIVELITNLVKAIDCADDDTQGRIYQALGQRRKSLPDKIAQGGRRFRRCREAILELQGAAEYASTRPQHFYSVTSRQKSLPHYTATFLHELVDVWCNVFSEGFRAPTTRPIKRARKGGSGLAPEHYGVKFVMTVLDQIELKWPEQKVLEQLKRVRESRINTSALDSKKSSDSDQASRIMRNGK